MGVASCNSDDSALVVLGAHSTVQCSDVCSRGTSIFRRLLSSVLYLQPDTPRASTHHVMSCRIMRYHYTRHRHTTYRHFLSCVLSSVQLCVLATVVLLLPHSTYVHLTCSTDLMTCAIYYDKLESSRFYVPSFQPILDGIRLRSIVPVFSLKNVP